MGTLAGWWMVFFLLVTVASGQPEGAPGVVSGKVINGSLGDTPAVHQQVILHRYIVEKEDSTFKDETLTDSTGSYSFDGLAVAESFAYYPVVTFGGVEYSGPLVRSPGESHDLGADITVFETTSSDSEISTAMHHMIIEPGSEFLSVREVLYFNNSGRYTYVGNTLAGSGKNAVLRLEFPRNARELQMGGDLMSCCLVSDDNLIFDTMEFKPGTRVAVASYQLPLKGNEAVLTKTVGHPTENLDVFLQDLNLDKLTVNQGPENDDIVLINHVEEPEPFEIRGKQYSRYDVGNVQRGQTFTLEISNLSTPQRDFRWLAPVVLVLIMIWGYLSNRSRRRLEISSMARDGKEPGQLITEISRTDRVNSQ